MKPQREERTLKCASPKEIAAWREAARVSRLETEAGFCTDCTPEYARKQRACGRCVYPEVKFAIDEDGFIMGFWPRRIITRVVVG